MILSGVCIFLTLYLYYRFTEIQHSNLDTQNKVLELQQRLDQFLAQQAETKAETLPQSESDSSAEDSFAVE